MNNFDIRKTIRNSINRSNYHIDKKHASTHPEYVQDKTSKQILNRGAEVLPSDSGTVVSHAQDDLFAVKGYF